MTFKIFVTVTIILFAIVFFWLCKLYVEKTTSFEASGEAAAQVHNAEYNLRHEINLLDHKQELYHKEIEELKDALNDQGIATGYTIEKKLYYKDKKDE